MISLGTFVWQNLIYRKYVCAGIFIQPVRTLLPFKILKRSLNDVNELGLPKTNNVLSMLMYNLFEKKKQFHIYCVLRYICFSQVESAWTICKLSPTLSWLDWFKSLDEVMTACYRRALCYPLSRHWDLTRKVYQDVKRIFQLGTDTVCLFQMLCQKCMFLKLIEGKLWFPQGPQNKLARFFARCNWDPDFQKLESCFRASWEFQKGPKISWLGFFARCNWDPDFQKLEIVCARTFHGLTRKFARAWLAQLHRTKRSNLWWSVLIKGASVMIWTNTPMTKPSEPEFNLLDIMATTQMYTTI